MKDTQLQGLLLANDPINVYNTKKWKIIFTYNLILYITE